MDEYQLALSFDSSYALAYSGISMAYFRLGNCYLISPREAWQRSTEAAHRALGLDSTVAEAWVSLALQSLFWDWNWEQAKSQFERVIEMDPENYVAHHDLGHILLIQSRPEEAVDEELRAEKIDPKQEEASLGVGWLFYFRHEYEKAMSYYRKALAQHPEYYRTHRLIGTCYLLTHRNAEAVREISKSVDLSNGSIEEMAYLAYALGVVGEKEKAHRELSALQALAKQRIVSSYLFALIYTGLGNKDQAFHYLDKAYQERAANMIYIGVEPLFDILRSDLRFSVLLKNMGLDKWSGK
jgi:tetratricopeptide (TPR) repeat protein